MKICISHFILVLFLNFNCSSSKRNFFVFENVTFESIRAHGAKGDGKSNDVLAIQNAFDKTENIFFPKGDYLIGSSSGGIHNPQSLLITNLSKVRKIKFEKGARLLIKSNFVSPISKNSILKIYTLSGDIPYLNIDGLEIYQEKEIILTQNTGIFAIENNNFSIKDLHVSNSSFYNLSGAAIITYALRTTLKNIYTENTSSHGIGALNPYNLGKEHFLFIDGYTSMNDKAYSIDFSGVESADNRSISDPRDTWTGVVRNIKSINSKRGIKTAGYWNLDLEDVSIINSSVYGFFINKDAPGRSIKFKNLRIENSANAGLSLVGKTKFEGDSLYLINCKMGAQIQNADVSIRNFFINGLGQAKMGLRLQSSGSITGFVVTGIVEEYAVWVTGKNVTLKNGKIFNNDSSFGMIIHEKAENITIDNVVFFDDRLKTIQNNDVMVIQEKGNLRIVEVNNESNPNMQRAKEIRKMKIENRSGIKIEKSY